MIFKSTFVGFLLLVLFACESKTSVKPSYTGAPGELLIVVEDKYWSALEDDILEVLQPNYPMLPQPEAAFTILQYQPKEISQLLERHRNVLQIDINKDYELEPVLKKIESQNAKNQLTFKIEARELEDAKTAINTNASTLVKHFLEEERIRYQNWFRLHEEKKVEEQIAEIFGYQVVVPKGGKLLEKDSNFVRLSWEREKILGGTRHFVTVGLALYKYPYSDTNAFSDTILVANRNRYLNRIPGPKEGSVMSTQTFIPAEATIINPKPGFSYAADFRGLWRTTNSFLGGPFVSLAQLDNTSDNIIVAEAFVLAPKFDKREIVKEAEAIVYSIAPAR